LLLLLVLVESTNWYAVHDLTQQETDALIGKECFRGSYLGGLSLLTCDYEGAQFISELPDHTPVCVIEARQSNKERASEIATRSGEVAVIYTSRNSLVLAAKSHLIYDFPAPCLEHFDENGVRENVITVPSFPVRPEVFVPASAAPDPKIQRVIDEVNVTRIRERITWLQNTFNTRHSQSTSSGSGTGINLPGAISEIQTIYRQYAGWTVSTQSLNRTGYNNPNILAIRTGTRFPNQYVVFGAHLDDRNSNLNDATGRAPGADDNGSGTITVLELARLISQNSLQFQYSLAFAHFTGEEQGLYGSQRMAEVFYNQALEKGDAAPNTVIAMYNVDMVAYNQTTTPSTMGLTNSSGRVSPALINECIAVFREYLTASQLAYGTSTACCSDQQSFQSRGFPSMSFFETTTSSVVYPQYHTSTDLSNATGYSIDQSGNFAKAVYACVMTKALVV
jgi:hypothetical protein